jgi:hypothetical protein
MFGRGNWAVFGVESASIVGFQKALADPLTAFKVSQLAASITSKFQNQEALGINPFGSPRLDETVADVEAISNLSDILVRMDGDSLPNTEDLQLIQNSLGFVGTEETMSLSNNKYGFWVVLNYPEDPTDPNSKKEQIAYTDRERPFKFLVKEEKKTIEDQVAAEAVLNRSQFPVLVDFQNGRVYVASSNKDDVISVADLLTKLGAKTFPLVWDFKYPTWPTEFLSRIVDNTHFTADMKKRADELARFREDEIEKLDDKQVEKIVSTFFALAPLETELWAGLSTPARIRIHKPIDPVTVASPSVAFSLLNMSNDAEVASAAVVFQELAIRNTKDGEKTFRRDVFTIDINDNVNLQDAGSALLRGFDLPQFKREVKTAIKAKGRLTIKDFWYMWLDGLHLSILEFIDNVVGTLEIDKKYGLIVPAHTNNEVGVPDEEEV